MSKRMLAIVSVIIVGFLIIVGGIYFFRDSSGDSVNNMAGSTATASKEYNIYPNPHAVEYGEQELTLNQATQVVYDDTIDDVTKDKATSIFADHHLPEPKVTDEPSNQAINIYIGTKGSDGPAEQQAQDILSGGEQVFDNNDAYQLVINEDSIAILGKDTDAAFYGLATLDMILDQTQDNAIRQVQIEDYANTAIRGFIEGYYGIPWSNEDRKSLMEFGGKFKTTSYIFAPKDDPYHREKWDDLYPEEELDEISDMVAVGKQNKTDFVWSISPLGEVAEIAQDEGEEAAMDLVDENNEKLLAKFDQLYDAGVREFGILGDDVGALPLDYVVEQMNAVSKWADEKGDVKDTIYTPAAYNSDWAWDDGEELNVLEENFADNVQILWTGETTVAPVTQDTVDDFKNLDNEGNERRDPLFWLNWPVNDVDMERVFLGKGDMLESNVEGLSGVVTNPMQEAEASKIAIFAIADYAWNNEDFDAQQSWEDSMQYVETNATAAFSILAQHMTHADPGEGLEADESENLKGLLDGTLEHIENGESIEDTAPELINELEYIANAGEIFLDEADNENLKEELTPFVNALHDMVLADVEYLKAQEAIDDDDRNSAQQHYEEGQKLREESLDYDRPMLEGEEPEKAKPAGKRLQPFTDELEDAVKGNLGE
ncbi:MAG: beta-N-acetylglucosaminidase domain-containing protein [Tetragenococcus koreensis]|nr:beta-N-acetylglucosaminidase domain-containing protein [Tetragenococcus koreensis]